MAQFDSNREVLFKGSLPEEPFPFAFDGEGLHSFLEWVTFGNVEPTPEEGLPPRREGHHQETVFQTDIGWQIVQEKYVAQCLLDYVFYWLDQGTAARDCLTWDAYLRAVIGIIAEYYAEESGGYLSFLRAAHGDNFPVFLFNPDQWDGKEPIEGAEGYRHPALNRDRFEFYQARIAREGNERLMRQLVNEIAAEKQQH